MNRWAKISWLVGGLALIILLTTRFIMGGWDDFMWAPFALAVLGISAALFLDLKFYYEFLTMRTTKHGMNMGVLILLALALLVCVNFLSVQYNKTFDATEEGILTLSPQTLKLLGDLKEDIHITVFYPGNKPQGKQFRTSMKTRLHLYKEESAKIKIQFVDPYLNVPKAKKYLTKQTDIQSMFVEYKEKRVRVEPPYDEGKITSAMIRATRSAVKKIYFLQGHGEKRLDTSEEHGLSDFKLALNENSFEAHSLNLMESGAIPEDTSILAIINPQAQVQPPEIKKIIEFIKNGGELLLAIDPESRHSLDEVLKSVGVEHNNNYILTDQPILMGQGIASAVSLDFDSDHEITKDLQSGNNFTLFNIASELTRASDLSEKIKVTAIVKAHPSSFTVRDLQKLRDPKARSQRGTKTIAMASEGLSGDVVEGNDFRAVVIGDSEFLSNRDLIQGYNRDLALNIIAYLSKETDLLSIRPKQPKGTQLTITETTKNIVVLSSLGLPIALFCLGGIFFYRRRNA